MAEIEDIRAASRAAEAEADAIAKAIASSGQVVPANWFFQQQHDGKYRTEFFGVDMNAYGDDEVGGARAMLALHEARRDYLKGRFDELNERVVRQQAAARRSQGISRFVGDGDLSLPRILSETARSEPARTELHQRQFDQRQEARQRVLEAHRRLAEDKP